MLCVELLQLKEIYTMATAKTKKQPETTPNVEESALKELFVDELKDIYWAEKHLSKALVKLAKAATSDELRAHHS